VLGQHRASVAAPYSTPRALAPPFLAARSRGLGSPRRQRGSPGSVADRATHTADCGKRQARGWQRDEDAATDAQALAERARAEAGRLRRALADAEIDLQRRAAASATEQRNGQARPAPPLCAACARSARRDRSNSVPRACAPQAWQQVPAG